MFDAGEYYECHEVVEGLWLEVRGPLRDLYKGLIQAAAALYQYERGVWTGALSLYRTSVGYLRPYAPASQGLNVAALIAGLEACFAPLESWDGKGQPPPFDRARAPRTVATDEGS